jgi:hypothetical protein
MRRRRTVPIKTRPTFAIVVDGDCEVWYLQMLKRNERSIVVDIEPRVPQRKSLTDQFEIVKELSKDYTKVFWIIDLDVITQQTRGTKKGAKSPLQFFNEYNSALGKQFKNVVVIVNNPCLEFWFLLHFEPTSKYFDTCAGAEKQLKKYLPDYEKTKKYFTKDDNDIYLKLRPKLSDAIKNAKKLGKFEATETRVALTELQLLFETQEFEGHFKDKKSES